MTSYALDESTNTKLRITYVKDISNAHNIHKNILSGNWDCCIVKPELIVHPLQILVAANRAILNKLNGSLVTKSLNTELLYNLYPSKNITQALKTFGFTGTDRNCLVVVFEERSGPFDVASNIEGNIVELETISSSYDEKTIKKLYKITEEELGVSTLKNSVVSRVATKGAD